MRALLLLIVLLLCSSCSIEPLYSEQITVEVTEQHPWHALSHTPLWKTLVYSDGRNLRTIHLGSHTNTIELSVPRGALVAICVYPLGSCAPWGGFYGPRVAKTVSLTQKKGALAHLLLEHWNLNPYALQAISPSLLASYVADGRLVDQMALLRSLCEGREIEVIPYEPLQVSFTNLPEGRWVSEYCDGVSFFARWAEEQQVVAFDGVQRWLNKERSLCLSLAVDLPSRRSIWALYPAPLW